jgi:glycolate oxidase
LVPDELGRGFGVMADIKRILDPHNVMNPGKYLLDLAYQPDLPAALAALKKGAHDE